MREGEREGGKLWFTAVRDGNYWNQMFLVATFVSSILDNEKAKPGTYTGGEQQMKS